MDSSPPVNSFNNPALEKQGGSRVARPEVLIVAIDDEPSMLEFYKAVISPLGVVLGERRPPQRARPFQWRAGGESCGGQSPHEWCGPGRS